MAELSSHPKEVLSFDALNHKCHKSKFSLSTIFLDFTEVDINPSNLRGEALSSYEVQLDWLPSQYNCDVIGYSVQIVALGMTPRVVDVEGGDTSMVVVSMLQPAMRYNFRLSAVTDNGNLPPVANVTVETPDGPGNNNNSNDNNNNDNDN